MQHGVEVMTDLLSPLLNHLLIFNSVIGKYRTEVWNDDVNPINDWWEAYSQSEEEIEAMAAGYDFNNPEEYFKAKGINLTSSFLSQLFT